MRRSLCWEVLTQQNPKSHLRSLSLKPIRHTGMQSQLWLFSIKVLTDITTRIHRCFLYDLDLAKIKSMQTMRVKVLETASKRKKKEKRIIHKVEVQNGISCQTDWIIKWDGEEDPASSLCSSGCRRIWTRGGRLGTKLRGTLIWTLNFSLKC